MAARCENCDIMWADANPVCWICDAEGVPSDPPAITSQWAPGDRALRDPDSVQEYADAAYTQVAYEQVTRQLPLHDLVRESFRCGDVDVAARRAQQARQFIDHYRPVFEHRSGRDIVDHYALHTPYHSQHPDDVTQIERPTETRYYVLDRERGRLHQVESPARNIIVHPNFQALWESRIECAPVWTVSPDGGNASEVQRITTEREDGGSFDPIAAFEGVAMSSFRLKLDGIDVGFVGSFRISQDDAPDGWTVTWSYR